MGAHIDRIGLFADSARQLGKRTVDIVVRYFALSLLGISWVGAAFLKDLVWPSGGAEAKPSWMYAVAALIVLAGLGSIYLQARDTTQTSELRRRVESLSSAVKSFGEDYRDIWTFVLYRWALGLSFNGGHRISIYKHEGGHFIMIARFSSSKPLSARGRSIYPDDQGCIGRAWRAADGRCFTNDFPNPETQSGGRRYRDKQRNVWGLPAEVADALTMKPRAIYALALLDDAGQRHAIAVFESLDRNGLDVAAIEAFMGANGNEEANRWMAATKNQLPSIWLAQQEGL